MIANSYDNLRENTVQQNLTKTETVGAKITVRSIEVFVL